VASDVVESLWGGYMLAQAALVAAVPLDQNQVPAIYPVLGRQDSNTDPYIIWEFVEYSEEQPIGGPADVADARVKISCFSMNWDTAKAVGRTVRDTFRFLQFPVALGPHSTILGYWVISSPDDADASEAGLFESVVEIGMQLQFA
jgi:hypothetical protein